MSARICPPCDGHCCQGRDCPARPHDEPDHNEGPGVLASPVLWLVIAIELGALVWWLA